MNRLKLVCIVNLILLILSFSPSSQAGEEKAGTSAASFLKIGVGARASGMGEAYCAVADDPTAIYWNPAGLGLIKSNQLTYVHNLWFKDTTTGFLGLTHPFKNFNLGVGIDYLTMGKETKTTEDYPRGRGEEFGVEDDTAIYFSLSKRMKENLSLGMSIKYINQKVADESASACGADLGLLYRLPKLNLGLVIQNLGPDMKFAKKKFSLPFNVKMGLSYEGIKNTTLALDINLPRDDKVSYHLGGEYWIRDILALRAGYNSHILGNKLGEFNLGEGLSAGFGVKIKTLQVPLQLDFSYVPYGDLGNTYRVSLLSRLGDQKAEGRRQGAEEKVEVKDEGDYTRDKTGLHASWPEVPKAREYQYALGTSPGGMDILEWTSAGKETKIDATGLTLADGQTYYINVRAKKRKLLIFPYWQALGSSDGIIVDSTPPSEPIVTDDGAYTITSEKLHFAWSSTDQVSGVKEYLYALGTSPRSADILGWRSAGPKKELALTDPLNNGKTCYLSVRAIDNADNESIIGSSDGIMVDATPPTTPVVTDDGDMTTDTTFLHVSWSSTDDESGIIEYQYAIGTTPKGMEVIGWTSSGDTEVEMTGLNLQTGQTYYISVQARNKAGLWSEAGSSDGIVVVEAGIPEIGEEEEIVVSDTAPAPSPEVHEEEIIEPEITPFQAIEKPKADILPYILK